MSQINFKTVSVKVPEELHQNFNQYCHKGGFNKSAVLRILMSGLISGNIKLVETQNLGTTSNQS